ncbi:hypothetical protein FRB95_004909 [Tulasnella sp. JGI-2019a]|nr:hypothetical protein FRB95_004909 [Tulasnella sp. JGI-2019a]
MIKIIQKFHPGSSALDRYELAMKCRVSQWLHPAYNTFCTREEAITADEGSRLGYARLTAICKIRELFRSSQASKVCCDHCKSIDLLPPTSPPSPSPTPNALTWILEAPDLQAAFPEDLEEPIAAPGSYNMVAASVEELKEQGQEIMDGKQGACVPIEDTSAVSDSDQQPDAAASQPEPGVNGPPHLPIANASESKTLPVSDNQRPTRLEESEPGEARKSDISNGATGSKEAATPSSGPNQKGEVTLTDSANASSDSSPTTPAHDPHSNGIKHLKPQSCPTCERPMILAERVATKHGKHEVAESSACWACMSCRREQNSQDAIGRGEMDKAESCTQPKPKAVAGGSPLVQIASVIPRGGLRVPREGDSRPADSPSTRTANQDSPHLCRFNNAAPSQEAATRGPGANRPLTMGSSDRSGSESDQEEYSFVSGNEILHELWGT